MTIIGISPTFASFFLAHLEGDKVAIAASKDWCEEEGIDFEEQWFKLRRRAMVEWASRVQQNYVICLDTVDTNWFDRYLIKLPLNDHLLSFKSLIKVCKEIIDAHQK